MCSHTLQMLNHFFFCAINFPVSWTDYSLTAWVPSQVLRRIGNYKICVYKGSTNRGAWNFCVDQLALIDICILSLWLSSMFWQYFIPCYGRPASEECEECIVFILVIKYQPTKSDKRMVWEYVGLFDSIPTQLVGLHQNKMVFYPE